VGTLYSATYHSILLSLVIRFTYLRYLLNICRPGGSLGIATDYGLDGPRSNPGGDEIYSPSSPAQPPVKWVQGLSRG